MAKYQGSHDSGSIFVKKYFEANVSRYSTAFFLTGACVAIGVLLMAANYQPPVEVAEVAMDFDGTDEVEEEIPQTNQTPPPPPPPPPPPEVIEVEDEEEIEEEPEIFEQEFETEQVIEEVVYEEPEPEPEEPEEPDFFIVVEDMPEFPGGGEKAMYKWLGKNIKYPQVAKENGIEGKVFIRFLVNERGAVTNAEVVRGIGGGCDEEALRVVEKMPNWKPGKQRGKPVRVQFTIPIHFQLN